MSGKAVFVVDPSGWFHAAPFGEFPYQDGEKEILQVIDEESVAAIVSNIRIQKAVSEGGNGVPWAGLLINQDHLLYQDEAATTEAMGWILDAQQREDGLWLQAKWSAEGLRRIEGGVYKFVSPEFPVSGMEDLGNNRLRPRQLCGVALTNKPNLSGLKPLCNSRTEETNQQKQSPDNPAERQQAMNELKQIALALGLGENATLEDVLAKLQADREAKLESEAADFVAANKAKIADETVVLNAYKKDPEGTKVLVNAMATPKAEPVRIPPTLVIAPKTPAAPAVAGSYTAPDGKAYANKLAYHRTLKGAEKTAFLNANKAELMALEQESKDE